MCGDHPVAVWFLETPLAHGPVSRANVVVSGPNTFGWKTANCGLNLANIFGPDSANLARIRPNLARYNWPEFDQTWWSALAPTSAPFPMEPHNSESASGIAPTRTLPDGGSHERASLLQNYCSRLRTALRRRSPSRTDMATVGGRMGTLWYSAERKWMFQF